MRTPIARSLLAGAALCVSVGLSSAQPQPTPPAAPPPQRAAEQDRPALRARLERRLEESKRVQERNEAGMQVREIMAERDPETRELRLSEMKNGFETLGPMRQFRDSVREGKPSPEAESRLRQLIGEHFDLMLKLREKEIVRLESRLAQLRDE